VAEIPVGTFSPRSQRLGSGKLKNRPMRQQNETTRAAKDMSPFTLREAAIAVKIRRATLIDKLKTGEIGYIQRGNRILIPREEIRRFLHHEMNQSKRPLRPTQIARRPKWKTTQLSRNSDFAKFMH